MKHVFVIGGMLWSAQFQIFQKARQNLFTWQQQMSEERKKKCVSTLEDQAPDWYGVTSITFCQPKQVTRPRQVQGLEKQTTSLQQELQSHTARDTYMRSSGGFRLLYKKATQQHIRLLQPNAGKKKKKMAIFLNN